MLYAYPKALFVRNPNISNTSRGIIAPIFTSLPLRSEPRATTVKKGGCAVAVPSLYVFMRSFTFPPSDDASISRIRCYSFTRHELRLWVKSRVGKAMLFAGGKEIAGNASRAVIGTGKRFSVVCSEASAGGQGETPSPPAPLPSCRVRQAGEGSYLPSPRQRPRPWVHGARWQARAGEHLRPARRSSSVSA